MSLPILNTPTYSAKIPSTGKDFNFRPFIVKEQKILLMALESGDLSNIYHGLRDIIKSCLLSEIGNIETMPLFDLEGIFLSIAAKSTGEIAKVGRKCSSCGHPNEIEIPIENVTLKNFKQGSNRIQLNEKVGIILRYPTLKDALDLSLESEQDKKKSDEELSFNMITKTIESVFDEKSVYSGSDYTEEELKNFVETFQLNHLKMIKNFLVDAPYLSYIGSFECDHCKHINEYEVKGIRDFFF
jgi:phage FluMu protein Com